MIASNRCIGNDLKYFLMRAIRNRKFSLTEVCIPLPRDDVLINIKITTLFWQIVSIFFRVCYPIANLSLAVCHIVSTYICFMKDKNNEIESHTFHYQNRFIVLYVYRLNLGYLNIV